MRKYISFCLMLIISCLSVSAQVNFKLQSDGSFRTIDGEDYVVIPFEGKSTHDLFFILTSNTTSLYKYASKVMNTVQDNIVTIYGRGNIFPYISICNLSFKVSYQLEFKIKDGRIRVSAPKVEDDAIMTCDAGTLPVSYSEMVAKDLFDKNGTVKKEGAVLVGCVEVYFNAIINLILTEEEW